MTRPWGAVASAQPSRVPLRPAFSLRSPLQQSLTGATIWGLFCHFNTWHQGFLGFGPKLSLSPDTGDVPGCAVRERGGHSDAPHSPVHARTCSDLVIPTPQVRPQAHAQMLPEGMIFVPGLSEARPYHRLLCKLLVELEPLVFMFTRTLCGPVWISVAAWDFSISTAILSPSTLARSSRVLSRLMSCLGVHEHPGSLTGQGWGGGGTPGAAVSAGSCGRRCDSFSYLLDSPPQPNLTLTTEDVLPWIITRNTPSRPIKKLGEEYPKLQLFVV